MSHRERRNEGEGKKKKKRNGASPRVRRTWGAAGGCLAPCRQLGGADPIPAIGTPGASRSRTQRPRIVRGRMKQWQLLFGRDLASCVS